MYKIIIIFLILFQVNLYSQYNEPAQILKKTNAQLFKKTIINPAIDKWGSDYSMVVYEVNEQSDALVHLFINYANALSTADSLGLPLPKVMLIMVNLCKRWSYEEDAETKVHVKEYIDDLRYGKDQLGAWMHFVCDWTMVKAEFDKQVKSYFLIGKKK